MEKNNVIKCSNTNNSEKLIYNSLYELLDMDLITRIPDFNEQYHRLPERTVSYLYKTISKFPWLNQFVYYAIAMNQEGESAHLYTRLCNTNTFFKWIKQNNYDLNENSDIKNLFMKYKITKGRISETLTSYCSLIMHSNRYLDDYPEEIKIRLRKFLLPEIKSDLGDLYRIRIVEESIVKTKRIKQTTELKKNLTNIVAIARTRRDWMIRFSRQLSDLKIKIRNGSVELPLMIYMPGFDGAGEITFKVWNKSSWIINHPEKYRKLTLNRWLSMEGTKSDNIFLQFIGIIPSDCWFLNALKVNFLQGYKGISIENRNYAEVNNLPNLIFKQGHNSGILNCQLNTAGFLSKVIKMISKDPIEENKIFFQPEPLIAASLIGYLALSIISFTGMRVSEIQQLCLEKSIKHILLPQYNDEAETWEDDVNMAYIFEVFTKGKTGLQKTYAPKIIIDDIKTHMKIYREINGTKLQPVPVCAIENSFTLTRYYKDQSNTWIFQWKENHLANQSINKSLYFILLEKNLIDEEGRSFRLSSHAFRHGFAGYLKQKGVPLERIATLLHHVNLLVTDYYSHEPDEVIMEQLYSLINDIGGQLQIEPGVIRSIDDVRKFEQECLKRFGALRKVIGGKCGVYCSCEAMNMCAKCESFIPEQNLREEIVETINGELKVAEFYQKSDQHLMAERIKIDVRDWRIILAELDSWKNSYQGSENDTCDQYLLGELEVENDEILKPIILPLLQPKTDEFGNPELDDEKK